MLCGTVRCSVPLLHQLRYTVTDTGNSSTGDTNTERQIVNSPYFPCVRIFDNNRTRRPKHAEVTKKTQKGVMKIDLLTAFEDTLQTDEKKADDKTYGNQPGKVAGSADHGYAVENHRKKLDVPQGDDGEIHKYSGT